MADNDADGLELIQAMSVLTVEPGDVVVLKAPIRLTAEQADNIRRTAKAVIKGAEVLVLSDGLDIGVLRSAA
jgi:lipopolysaccharide export system protein LptA